MLSDARGEPAILTVKISSTAISTTRCRITDTESSIVIPACARGTRAHPRRLRLKRPRYFAFVYHPVLDGLPAKRGLPHLRRRHVDLRYGWERLEGEKPRPRPRARNQRAQGVTASMR